MMEKEERERRKDWAPRPKGAGWVSSIRFSECVCPSLGPNVPRPNGASLDPRESSLPAKGKARDRKRSESCVASPAQIRIEQLKS